MDMGSPRWRTGAGIIAWILIAVATAGLAWAAVAVVAGQGAAPASVAVPTQPPVDLPSPSSESLGAPPSGEQPPADDTTSSTGQSTTATGTATDDAAISLESVLIPSSGGSVWVACTASDTIQRKSVTPADGWQHALDDDGSDDEVEVTFVRADDEEIRIRARCQNGRVDSDVSD